MKPERSAQAQVVSLNTARLTAEIAAPIQALPVEPGQVLQRGAVVARLDCRDHEIAARLAAVQLERAQRLVGENFISRDQRGVRWRSASCVPPSRPSSANA